MVKELANYLEISDKALAVLISYHPSYARDYFFDLNYPLDVRDRMGVRHGHEREFSAARVAVRAMKVEELIKLAFELGFIEQAMKCQEAYRRAQQE